jgi:hypothetical protein
VGPGYSAGGGQMDSNPFKWFQTNSNPFKLHSIQIGHYRAQKIEIKYGFEGFNERNNFPYRNVHIFEMYFELKIREPSRDSI